MKTQSFFTFIGIFAVLFLSLSLVSATNCLHFIETSVPASVNIADGGIATVNFQLTNNDTCSTAKTGLVWALTANKAGTFTSVPTITSIADDAVIDLSATFKVDSSTTGNLQITVDLTGSDSENETLVLTSVPITNFCEAGVPASNKLEIKDFDLNNLDGDDEEWAPLDEITFDVDIKNTGSDKISKVNVEVKILDEDGVDVTDDFDLDDDTIDLGSISDGKTETATFTISELPADLEDATYRIYVKAYSKGDEDLQCVDYSTKLNKNDYYEFEIVRDEDEAVIVKDFVSSISAEQGETLQLNYQIYNVGTEDQEDVLVVLKSVTLGINEREHISNLDVGDKKDISFSVKIPSTATPKEYDVKLVIYFSYDDGDILSETSYDLNSFEDLDEDYNLRLSVEGTPVSVEPTITASLSSDSDATVGGNLIIQVSVKNNGDSSTNFVIAVQNTEAWAEAVDVSPQILTIAQGSVGQATITLKPTKAGTQTFDVTLIYNGQEKTQAVSVTIAEKTGFLTGAFSGFGVDNTALYLIAAVFLILIIVILVLIVKVSRAPKPSEF